MKEQIGLVQKETILFAGHFVEWKSFKLIQYNTGPARDCGVFLYFFLTGGSRCTARVFLLKPVRQQYCTLKKSCVSSYNIYDLQLKCSKIWYHYPYGHAMYSRRTFLGIQVTVKIINDRGITTSRYSLYLNEGPGRKYDRVFLCSFLF